MADDERQRDSVAIPGFRVVLTRDEGPFHKKGTAGTVEFVAGGQAYVRLDGTDYTYRVNPRDLAPEPRMVAFP